MHQKAVETTEVLKQGEYILNIIHYLLIHNYGHKGLQSNYNMKSN
jgi:hypothetical protein